MGRRFIADFFLQGEEGSRLEIAEGQILELTAHHAHAQAERDGRVDVQRLARNALLLFGFEVFECAHVVEPVGQLDENDADVVHHGEQHFADVFGLARFRRHHVQAADFRYPLDEMGDLDGIFGVFDGIV